MFTRWGVTRRAGPMATAASAAGPSALRSRVTAQASRANQVSRPQWRTTNVSHTWQAPPGNARCGTSGGELMARTVLIAIVISQTDGICLPPAFLDVRMATRCQKHCSMDDAYPTNGIRHRMDGCFVGVSRGSRCVIAAATSSITAHLCASVHHVDSTAHGRSRPSVEKVQRRREPAA